MATWTSIRYRRSGAGPAQVAHSRAVDTADAVEHEQRALARRAEVHRVRQHVRALGRGEERPPEQLFVLGVQRRPLRVEVREGAPQLRRAAVRQLARALHEELEIGEERHGLRALGVEGLIEHAEEGLRRVPDVLLRVEVDRHDLVLGEPVRVHASVLREVAVRELQRVERVLQDVLDAARARLANGATHSSKGRVRPLSQPRSGTKPSRAPSPAKRPLWPLILLVSMAVIGGGGGARRTAVWGSTARPCRLCSAVDLCQTRRHRSRPHARPDVIIDL